jgi:hypothetical protein
MHCSGKSQSSAVQDHLKLDFVLSPTKLFNIDREMLIQYVKRHKTVYDIPMVFESGYGFSAGFHGFLRLSL